MKPGADECGRLVEVACASPPPRPDGEVGQRLERLLADGPDHLEHVGPFLPVSLFEVFTDLPRQRG